MEIIVRVPGSCGELVQGYLHGAPFLVTCPINRFSTAVVRDDGKQIISAGEKARQALRKTLDYLGKDMFPYSLTIQSELPVGKGMASSSADIAAAIISVSAALGYTINENEIAYLAASIEPTDGIFCRGVVSINYMTGKILHAYGILPPLSIAIFDLGGTIDTLHFHRKYDKFIQCSSSRSAAALHWLHFPYTADNIGAAATYSARAQQTVLYKPVLEELLHKGMLQGAVGIVAAHSGTVCGLLFPPQCSTQYVDEQIGKPLAHQLALSYIGAASLISGGWHIEER